MMKVRLLDITFVLLCVISTISSKLQKPEVVENKNTKNTVAAILGSNDQQDEPKNVKNQASKNIGVSWDKNPKKWKAPLKHNKIECYSRLFENEEHADMKVNLLCDRLGKKGKNTMIDMKPVKIQQIQNLFSKYTGVVWNKNTKKWQSQLKHNKTKYYGGLFENEEHAAMKVNSLCDRLGIEHKNPTIDIEADKIQRAQNHTSIYTGVCWYLRDKKWKADLMHKRKKYFGGLFDKEEHAAMSINLLCDKYKVKRKNPTIDIKLFEVYQHHTQTSKYTGVSWCEDRQRLRARLIHKKKEYYGGYFQNEEDAAMSVNLLCDKCEIERKNPMIDMKLFKDQQQYTQTSKYTGLSSKKDTKKWRSQLTANEKKYYGGLFNKEEDVAMKVNLLCDKYELKRKNPIIDIELFEDQQVRDSTSQYTYVSWDENNKKWRARLFHNGKKYSGGVFDNEKDAAMAVNLLCDKFEIQRKNPTIDMEFDAIRQKTKSKMYETTMPRPKTETKKHFNAE